MEELMLLESTAINEMTTIFGEENAKLKSELTFTSSLDNSTPSPEVRSGNGSDDSVHLQNIGRKNVLFSFYNSLTENLDNKENNCQKEIEVDSLTNIENTSETIPAIQLGGMSVLGDKEHQTNTGGDEGGSGSAEVCYSRMDRMQLVVVLHKFTTKRSVGALNIRAKEKEACSPSFEQSGDVFIDKPYVCSDCGQTFESVRYSSVLRHSCIPHNKEKQKKLRKNVLKQRNDSDEAGKLRKNAKQQKNSPVSNFKKRHVESHAPTDWSHRCAICDKTFRHEYRLKLHMLTHSTNRDKYQCPVCRKEFLDANYLKVHARIHEDQKDYACDTCGKAFRTKTNLTIHRFVHGPPQFQCSICNRSFRLKHSLKEHIRRHTSQDKFECPHCSKVFNSQNSLRTHVRTVHSTCQFKCEICLRSYKTKGHLKDHMNVHLRTNDSKCTLCEREFTYKASLICHMRAKHSSAEPHRCQVCNATFKEKGNLTRHRLTVHGIGILRLYRCKFCEAEFTAHHTYSNHVKRKHFLSEAPYGCGKCGRMFRYDSSLRYHWKTHKD